MDVVAGTILLCLPLPGAQAVGASMLGAGLGGIAGGYVSEAMGGSFETGAAIGSIVGAIVGGSIYRLVQHLRPIDVAKMAQMPPNDGAVVGTEQEIVLQPGKYGRYGNIGPESKYITQAGASASELSLPPWNNGVYTEITVLEPIPEVVQSIIAPWAPWNAVGGGIQYLLKDPIAYYIANGIIVC